MVTTTGTIIVKEVTEEATIVTTGREIAADISEYFKRQRNSYRY